MRKMYVILIVFLVNRIINAEDSSDEKYIDLLPEKQKAEFLEKIARRIFSGVQSKDDRDGVSGEVLDTELSGHNAFVNQILKEESLNLRKNGVKAGNDDYLNQKTDKNDDKSLEKKETPNAVDDAKLVDLTLLDNKRDKRQSLTNTDKESNIVRISVGNGEIKKQSQEKDDGEEKEGSDREDIQIKHFPKALVENTNDPKVTEYSKATNLDGENYKGDLKETVIASQSNTDESVKDSKSLETKEDKNKDIKDINDKGSTNIGIASRDDLDHSVKDARSQETKEDKNNKENENSSPKNNESSVKKDSEENSDEKIIVSTSMREPTTSDVRPTVVQTEKQTIGDYTTEADENISPDARLLRSYTKSNHSEDKKKEDIKNISEKLNSNTNIELVPVAVETINDFYKVNSSDSIKSESKIEKEANLGNENFVKPKSTTRVINKEKSPDKVTTDEGLDVTTLKTEVLTKASIRSGFKSTDSDDYKEDETIKTYEARPKATADKIDKNIKNGKEKHDKLNMNSYRFVNDMIKLIRAKIKPKEEDTHELHTIPLYDALKSKKYEVYEVPADKKPFVKQHQINNNKENPYYVPIYNYSPENAYYSPHNKFGPNADDNKNDIVNRSFNNEKYNENDDRDDDSSEDKNDKDISNIGFNENDESAVTAELKTYGGNSKRDSDRKFEKLIKGYKEYKNHRKFKFGSNKQTQIKKSSYKLNLPIVVQHPSFTDIILNPYDYLDVDYMDRKEKAPIIRSRCELPLRDNIAQESNEEIDIKNLKSHLRSVRLMLYKQKLFGYVPPANASKEESKDDVTNKTKEVLRSKTGKDIDENKNIAMDYFYGRPRDGGNSRFNDLDTYYTKGKYFDNYDEIKPRIKDNYKNKVFKNKNGIKTPQQIYNSETKLRSNKKKIDFDNIREILSMTDSKDLIQTLDKLVNLTIRSRDDDLEPYMTVLENMMVNDAKALKQYDWLGTTVDIQSALFKLMDMTDKISDGHTLPHPDLELLRYTIYLHKSTKKIRKQSRKTKIMPRNKKKRRGIIKESGLLNRHWLFRMLAKKYDTIITVEDFDDYNDFLNELQYYLYDLHTAVQQIANITKYNNQNWFKNLKELYLDIKSKNLLEILLHITTTRLLDLIQDGAKNGVAQDFLTFVINNENIVKRTQVEITFAQKIIDRLMIG